MQRVMNHNSLLVETEKHDKRQIKELTESLNNEKNVTTFQERSIASMEINIKTLEKMVE